MSNFYIYDKAKDRQKQISSHLKAIRVQPGYQSGGKTGFTAALSDAISTLTEACERVLSAIQAQPGHWREGKA